MVAKLRLGSEASVAKARETAEQLAEVVETLREQQKGSSWAGRHFGVLGGGLSLRIF